MPDNKISFSLCINKFHVCEFNYIMGAESVLINLVRWSWRIHAVTALIRHERVCLNQQPGFIWLGLVANPSTYVRPSEPPREAMLAVCRTHTHAHRLVWRY
jgi:hypothetical protein